MEQTGNFVHYNIFNYLQPFITLFAFAYIYPNIGVRVVVCVRLYHLSFLCFYCLLLIELSLSHHGVSVYKQTDDKDSNICMTGFLNC